MKKNKMPRLLIMLMMIMIALILMCGEVEGVCGPHRSVCRGFGSDSNCNDYCTKCHPTDTSCSHSQCVNCTKCRSGKCTGFLGQTCSCYGPCSRC